MDTFVIRKKLHITIHDASSIVVFIIPMFNGSDDDDDDDEQWPVVHNIHQSLLQYQSWLWYQQQVYTRMLHTFVKIVVVVVVVTVAAAVVFFFAMGSTDVSGVCCIDIGSNDSTSATTNVVVGTSTACISFIMVSQSIRLESYTLWVKWLSSTILWLVLWIAFVAVSQWNDCNVFLASIICPFGNRKAVGNGNGGGDNDDDGGGGGSISGSTGTVFIPLVVLLLLLLLLLVVFVLSLL
jgi:hypothetical protein